MGSCTSCFKTSASSPSMMKIENGSAPPHGKGDEEFFDSRGWLDSDCESDFFSMRGDFTPSCGSSPDRQVGNPAKLKTVDFDHLSDTQSEHSPRMKLGEFFHPINPNNAINGNLDRPNGLKTELAY